MRRRHSAGALTSPLLEEQLAVETARGAERASLLRRLLFMSDIVAAVVAGIAGALAGGLSPSHALIFAAVVALAWPVLAFMGGLYAVDTLGAWASGIPEIGRLAGAGWSSRAGRSSSPPRRWARPRRWPPRSSQRR